MSSPVLLSRQIISRSLADPKFYSALPEFSSLKPKLRTMGAVVSSGGCRGCKQRRVAQNVFNDFMTVLRTLDAASLTKLKRYLGAESLMYMHKNELTGSYENRII